MRAAASARGDQAEGLRRLIGRRGLRITLFVSGSRRAGCTTAAVGMALAAVQRGSSVMLLDESRSPTDSAALCGLTPRLDLLDAMRGERALEEVILPGPEGLLILPAARAMRAGETFGEGARATLETGFERLSTNVDWLMIDAACAASTRLLPLALSAQDVVIPVAEDGDNLTATYALLKLLNREVGLQRARLVASRVRREDRMREHCERLIGAARHYLGVRADMLATVPFDPVVQRAAALARPLMQAFPAAPAAQALRACTEALLRQPPAPQAGSPVGALVQRLLHGSRLELSSLAFA